MNKISIKDKAIHDQFLKCGKNSKEWMQKCILMLPQIEKNRIWQKKGFSSIYEYAAKLAGMSRNKVNDSLRIMKKIADKPALMEVVKYKGINAVRPVATIVTKETDSFWAKNAKEMSKNTLETFVKDFKNEEKFRPSTGSPQNNSSNKPVNFIKNKEISNEKLQISMKLDIEIVKVLQKIKGTGDWNEAMKKMLSLSKKERENEQLQNIQAEEKLKKELETQKPEPVKTQTHTAPTAIQKYIKKRSQGICEHPNCNKPGEHIHHLEPFAIIKKHDPDNLVHLCSEHHQIIHLGLIDDNKIQISSNPNPKQWQQINKLPSYDIKNLINERISEFKKQHILNHIKT